MGIRAYGQLCFGVIIPNDITLPWNVEDENGDTVYDGEIEEWWLDVLDYVNLYEWKENDTNVGYYKHRRDFLQEHPLPVKLVYYGDVDYPNYLIAVKDTVINVSMSEIEEVDVDNLMLDVSHAKYELINFCKQYLGIDNPEPKWYITSRMG